MESLVALLRDLITLGQSYRDDTDNPIFEFISNIARFIEAVLSSPDHMSEFIRLRGHEYLLQILYLPSIPLSQTGPPVAFAVSNLLKLTTQTLRNDTLIRSLLITIDPIVSSITMMFRTKRFQVFDHDRPFQKVHRDLSILNTFTHIMLSLFKSNDTRSSTFAIISSEIGIDLLQHLTIFYHELVAEELAFRLVTMNHEDLDENYTSKHIDTQFFDKIAPHEPTSLSYLPPAAVQFALPVYYHIVRTLRSFGELFAVVNRMARNRPPIFKIIYEDLIAKGFNQTPELLQIYCIAHFTTLAQLIIFDERRKPHHMAQFVTFGCESAFFNSISTLVGRLANEPIQCPTPSNLLPSQYTLTPFMTNLPNATDPMITEKDILGYTMALVFALLEQKDDIDVGFTLKIESAANASLQTIWETGAIKHSPNKLCEQFLQIIACIATNREILNRTVKKPVELDESQGIDNPSKLYRLNQAVQCQFIHLIETLKTGLLTVLDSAPDTVHKVREIVSIVSTQQSNSDWIDQFIVELAGRISQHIKQLPMMGNKCHATATIVLANTILQERPAHTASAISRTTLFEDAVQLIQNPILFNLLSQDNSRYLASLLLLIDLYLCGVTDAQRLAPLRETIFSSLCVWKYYDDRHGRWLSFPASQNATITQGFLQGRHKIKINQPTIRRGFHVHYNSLIQISDDGRRTKPMALWLVPLNHIVGATQDHQPKIHATYGLNLDTVPRVPFFFKPLLGCPIDYTDPFRIHKAPNQPDTNSILKSVMAILTNPIDSDVVHSALRLVLRFTQSPKSIPVFLNELHGLETLVSIPSSNAFLGILSLVIMILKHIIDTDHNLSYTMEKYIRYIMNSQNGRNPPSLGEGNREIYGLMRALTPLMVRNPGVFMEVLHRTVKVCEPTESNIEDISNGYGTMIVSLRNQEPGSHLKVCEQTHRVIFFLLELLKTNPTNSILNRSAVLRILSELVRTYTGIATIVMNHSAFAQVVNGYVEADDEIAPYVRLLVTTVASSTNSSSSQKQLVHQLQRSLKDCIDGVEKERSAKSLVRFQSIAVLVSVVVHACTNQRTATQGVSAGFLNCIRESGIIEDIIRVLTKFQLDCGNDSVHSTVMAVIKTVENVTKPFFQAKQNPPAQPPPEPVQAEEVATPDVEDDTEGDEDSSVARYSDCDEEQDDGGEEYSSESDEEMQDAVDEDNQEAEPVDDVLGFLDEIDEEYEAEDVEMDEEEEEGFVGTNAPVEDEEEPVDEQVQFQFDLPSRSWILGEDEDSAGDMFEMYSRLNESGGAMNSWIQSATHAACLAAMSSEGATPQTAAQLHALIASNPLVTATANAVAAAATAGATIPFGANLVSSLISQTPPNNASSVIANAAASAAAAAITYSSSLPLIHPLLLRRPAEFEAQRPPVRPSRPTDAFFTASRAAATAVTTSVSTRQLFGNHRWMPVAELFGHINPRYLRPEDGRNPVTAILSDLGLNTPRPDTSNAAAAADILLAPMVRWIEECILLNGPCFHSSTILLRQEAFLIIYSELHSTFQKKLSEFSNATHRISEPNNTVFEDLAPEPMEVDEEPEIQFVDLTIDGNQYRVPSWVDPTFLTELPHNIRLEVVQQQTRIARERERPPPPDEPEEPEEDEDDDTPLPEISEDALASMGISVEFLEELPRSIRAEVMENLRVQEANRIRAEEVQMEDIASNHDPTQFLRSLNPTLRNQLFLELEESQLAALPDDLATEASALRSQGTNRRNLIRNLRDRAGIYLNRVDHLDMFRWAMDDPFEGAPRVFRSFAMARRNRLPEVQLGEFASIELNEQMVSVLLTNVFLDDNRGNATRFQRVLRNIVSTHDQMVRLINSLIVILLKCSGRIECVLRHYNSDGELIMTEPNWLKLSRPGPFGKRVPSLLMYKSIVPTEYPTHLCLDEHASADVCRHVLEILSYLSNATPDQFILHQLDNSLLESGDVFWRDIMQTEISYCGSPFIIPSVYKSGNITPDTNQTVFAALISLVHHPIIKGDTALLDMLFGIVGGLSYQLDKYAVVKVEDGKFFVKKEEGNDLYEGVVFEKQIEAVIQVLVTPAKGPPKGPTLTNLTDLLTSISQINKATHEKILEMSLDGLKSIGMVLESEIRQLYEESSLFEILEEQDDEEEKRLQVPAMQPFIKKHSTQDFFLCVLRVVLELERGEDGKKYLSSHLDLSVLWSALDDCLLQLQSLSDPQTVLLLQPSVEAFFLVHAPVNQARRRRADARTEREQRALNLAHLTGTSEDHSPQESADLSITFGEMAIRERNQPTTDEVQRNKNMFLCFANSHSKVLNHILRQTQNALLDGPFTVLCEYTHILDFDVKRKYFQEELNSLKPPNLREDVTVNVRRDHLFEDSYRELNRRTAEEWKRKLYITFEGEEGQDAGGLLREWYCVISKEIFNPNYGLFMVNPADRVTYMPNPASHANSNHLSYFKFVGRVIAKAIFDGKHLDCYFTRFFYKHILGVSVDYSDMETVDHDFYKNLCIILETDASAYELNFSTDVQEFGATKTIDLKENGRNIPVSNENKQEYVRLLCHEKMIASIRPQLLAFLDGFYSIIPKRLISIFDEHELELLISGLPDIDVEDLRQNTEYHKYRANSPQIQWLWRALRSFEKDDLAKFVQFVTGTSKVPLGGFAHLEGMNGPQKMQIHRDERSSDRLPCAHTCFNQLDLPVYESYDKLRQRIMTAIHECQIGFGLA